MAASTTATALPVTLKWNKKTFGLVIEPGEPALSLKERVQTLTGVPVSRQKLLAAGLWKGPLQDELIVAWDNDKLLKKKQPVRITLIGSADTLTGPPKEKVTFIEDMTPEELEAQEHAAAAAAMATATGMIPALQLPPHKRDDGKQEMYAYSRLVTGLPQRQVESMLLEQKDKEAASQQQQQQRHLTGRVAMTLGMELSRAYVNDLAVLDDGTCVSALGDGHVQLWKHGAKFGRDLVHPGDAGSGGVDSVVTLEPTLFATAGRGYLRVWSSVDGDPVLDVPTSVPGTSPDSLVVLPIANEPDMTCLGARFQVVRQSNPSQFRLPPQNEAERLRRAAAEAQEQAIQQTLARASRSVQIWFDSNNIGAGGRGRLGSLQSQILEPPSESGSAPVSCLATIPCHDGSNSAILVVGDVLGGLRLWRVQPNSNRTGLAFHQQGFYQLVSSSSSMTACSIVCLQILRDGRIAVATQAAASSGGDSLLLPGATPIVAPALRGVHILNVSAAAARIDTTLNGHTKDAVICMCELPNGDILTGGGKLDATLQLWTREQTLLNHDDGGVVHVVSKSHATFNDVGYVFALTVLRDTKEDSDYYAVAAARYNTVKIIL